MLQCAPQAACRRLAEVFVAEGRRDRVKKQRARVLELLDATNVPIWVFAANGRIQDLEALECLNMDRMGQTAWESIISYEPNIRPCDGCWEVDRLILDGVRGFRFTGLSRANRLVIMQSSNLSFPDLQEAQSMTIRRGSRGITFPVLANVGEINDGRFSSVEAPLLALEKVRIWPCGDGGFLTWIEPDERGQVLLDPHGRHLYETLVVSANPVVYPAI
jgi:hypothetical protein